MAIQDPRLQELLDRYNALMDRVDGCISDMHNLDEEDEIELSEILSLEGRQEDLEIEADHCWDLFLERAREVVSSTLAVDPDSLEFGYYDCGKSLTNHCVYNVEEDPCQDSCLFCGDPRERK